MINIARFDSVLKFANELHGGKMTICPTCNREIKESDVSHETFCWGGGLTMRGIGLGHLNERIRRRNEKIKRLENEIIYLRTHIKKVNEIYQGMLNLKNRKGFIKSSHAD